MKSETEIRQLLTILRAFRSKERAIEALAWVLDEYPEPKPRDNARPSLEAS